MPSIAVVATGPVVRQGVCQLLAGLPSAGPVLAVTALAELPGDPAPEVLVVDWPADDVRGLAFPPGSRAVLLCDPAGPPGLDEAMRAGVRAFLTRDLARGDLVFAIEAVRQGGLHIAAELLGAFAPLPGRRERELSVREIELLQWVTQGLTNEAIGRRMRLTKSTVTSYVRQVRSKLNAVNKADLTRRAIELGYVVPR